MQQILTDQIHDNLINPLMGMFEVQHKTALQLMRNQVTLAENWLDVSARAGERLADARTVTEYLGVPAHAGWEISQKWLETVDRQWNTLLETGPMLRGEIHPRHSAVVATRDDNPGVAPSEQAASESADTRSNGGAAAKASGSAAKTKGSTSRNAGAAQSPAQ